MSQKLEKMLLEEERLKELSEAKNSAEVKKVYKKSGLDITGEQAEQFIKVRDNINANPPKDTEAFLDKIAGGLETKSETTEITITPPSSETKTADKNKKTRKKRDTIEMIFGLLGGAILGTLAAGAAVAGLNFAAQSGVNAADKLFGK